MNLISDNKDYKQKLQDTFIRYAKTWSESNGEAADKGIFPSTPQQRDFAKMVLQELKNLGIESAVLTDDCYIYASIAGTGKLSDKESVLLLAHMDTVDEVSGKNVNPVILTGAAATEFTSDNDVIIKSDGSTLLGGDDKAGMAAIMTSVEYLLEHKDVEHRPFEIIFSPDEETGHGMDKVPMDLIKSKFGYTVDGGEEGEMETECFNAWACTVEFTGKACHTGDGKQNGMINANLMMAKFISQLPADKRPETTEGHEGFIAIMKTAGSIESASCDLLLRAFTMDEINLEKWLIEKIGAAVEEETGGKVSVFFDQQYLNMKENLDKNPQVVQILEKAFEMAKVRIINKPIRGGTDGSRLTEMGIPTPNIFTGAHEFHSRNEWVSLNQMSKAADILLNILTN